MKLAIPAVANREQRRAEARGQRVPKPLPHPEMAEVQIADLQWGHPVVVPLSEREGVYVHSWKCLTCSLEFMTFSWQANRHRVGTIACPECGNRAPMFHCRAVVNESPTFSLDGPQEIFRLWPWPGSRDMDDSVVAP